MPSFLSSLRRKSKAAIRTDEKHGNGLSKKKSSATLNSSAIASTSTPATPASSTSGDMIAIQSNDFENGAPPLPTPRPQRPAVNPTKRYSLNGMPSTSSTPQFSGNPSSLLAPRVLSVSEGSWVHQQVLLIFGQVGESVHRPLDGTVTINHHHGHFPSTAWPVSDCYFKALVHLQPGWNRIRIDFSSPKVSTRSTSIPAHTSFLNINYLPLTTAPPLQLAIILGSDSPATYDVMPDRMQREGNGLDMAVKKFRTAAYLWQAFTGEQMYRNGFGRRCFRFEDSWEPGTLSYQDWGTGQCRTQAKIHIIRSSKTVAEIRDLEVAQQGSEAKKKDGLFDIARDAVKSYFQMREGQKQYVSCLFLDAHWDPTVQTIRGHAALGGDMGDIGLAIFGSHLLHSYPSSLEEVWQAFQDCTRTDTAFVANDCNDSGSNWEAANIGIGAHLHETGHLFGCPHQESGVMLRDYVTLNRTFTCRESYSTRTKSPGQRLVLNEDECRWHRLDVLRFRFHPCFGIPIDTRVGDSSVQVWTVDSGQGGVIATSKLGIPWIELYTEGDGLCRHWKEWPEIDNQYPRQVTLVDSELRALLPKDKRNSRLKIIVYSAGDGKHVVEDFNLLANQKLARVRLPGGRWGYRGSKLGYSQMEGSEPQELILESAHIQTKLLVNITVYHGAFVDGLEFNYEDGTNQIFGKRSGKSTEFTLDTRRGELLFGFSLRASLWIDGLQIITSLGRKSEWYGNAHGGSGHTLIPPRGYTIGGLSGSCAQWLDGFSLIITR
ncbi:putative peptidase family-domain-containing protein [Massariosphaeria phaeospora]|uniref:Putative peptidase family-domain-containing protein n=1 Tax=Massariosphaeria phaeospora TaxID=100035 RepID=A0A7C8M9D5_9PLEO|nr:putative peptidase family-domain-containing protein [Massariosphaeria phaeospora]